VGVFERFSPLLYVKLSPQRVVIENSEGTVLVDEVPDLALSPGPKVVLIEVGAKARDAAARAGAKCLNPFAHPRTLVSDFVAAEAVLKSFVRRASGGGVFSLAPRILMHPLGEPEGGFTQVEWRALRELGLGAGGSQVYLYEGRPVTVAERNSVEFLRRCVER